MASRLTDRFTFRVERLLVRGAQYRLLVIALAIALISIAGGAAVLAAGRGFDRLDEAVWWAFLRLTDPGYLGDDVGTVNRIVSTSLTVLGYVVFLGALVAVMTQWLNQRMERLEAGLTPVVRSGHVVVLGWTNRTEAVVHELLASRGRVRRFLRRVGARDLHIVVMARSVTATLAQDLRDAVGDAWEEHRVTLRSGTALRPEHLERVDAANAAAVIIPASEQAIGAHRADTHTLKTLLSLSRGGPGGRLPYVVAEVVENDKAELAEQIYPGEIEIVRSHAVVSRLLAQNARHPGLSHIYNQLLTQRQGADLFIREPGALEAATVGRAHNAFSGAVFMGLVRPDGGYLVPLLNPSHDTMIEAEDRLVILAREFEDSEPGEPFDRPTGDAERGASAATPPRREHPLRLLVLGWSHEVPALLEEFGRYPGERFALEVASLVSPEQREHDLRHTPTHAGVELRHLVLDFTHLEELRTTAPWDYDIVLFLGNDRLESTEESDARTVIGVLLLDQLLKGRERRPEVIVELLDPDNVRLLGDSAAEVIISPLIVSHMLAQVALRRELLAVFEELFTAGGAEIAFRPSALYGSVTETLSFSEIHAAALVRSEIALGLRRRGHRQPLHLVPPSGSRWQPGPDLDVVVLVREAEFTPAGAR